MTSIESLVKQKLGIRYVDAKRLVEEATKVCEIDGPVPTSRTDEVVEEACELFGDLPASEQQQMRQQANEEPDWKRRAREQAERREAEFAAKQAAQTQTEDVRDKLRDQGASEEEINGTTVKVVRKLQEEPLREGKGKVTVRRHTCYCSIM